MEKMDNMENVMMNEGLEPVEVTNLEPSDEATNPMAMVAKVGGGAVIVGGVIYAWKRWVSPALHNARVKHATKLLEKAGHQVIHKSEADVFDTPIGDIEE